MSLLQADSQRLPQVLVQVESLLCESFLSSHLLLAVQAVSFACHNETSLYHVGKTEPISTIVTRPAQYPNRLRGTFKRISEMFSGGNHQLVHISAQSLRIRIEDCYLLWRHYPAGAHSPFTNL